MIDYSILQESKFLRSLYPEGPPLQCVEIAEVTLSQAGLHLAVDIRVLPRKLPLKWLADKVNTVRIDLLATNPANLVISGWNSSGVSGELVIDKNSAGVGISIDATGSRIECMASFVFVTKVTGFCCLPEKN